MNKVKSLFKARWMSSLIFLLLLFLITGIAEPEFLSYSNIISCFNTATMYTLLAIGIAFVIMTGEIDVSIGSTLGLSAAMTGLIAKQDGSIAVMLLAVVATGAVIGLINGVGVAYFGVPSLIFTLGTNSVVRGMIYILSDGRTVENFGGSLASYGNLTLFAEITLYYALAILLVAAAHIVLTKTKKGKYFIAVGDNAGGANLVGISVTGTKLLAYVLCGVFAGLGGFVFASKYGQVMTVAGNGYEMTAIAACVLGGISLSGGLGNMVGAAIGAVIMSSISRLLVFIGLPSTYDNTITGIMLIVIVVVDALTQRRSIEMARRKRLLSRTAGKRCGRRVPGMNAVKKVFKHWEMFLLVFLILEFVIFGAVNPKFLRPQSIMNSIVNYISVCIIALFVTLVMITGGIDIQAASIIGLTSIIQGYLWSDLGLNIWTSVLLAIIVAAICGGLSGFFIAYCGVQPMVVTLGGSFLYSGLALLVSGMSATPAYQGISGFPAKTDDGAFIDYRFLGKGELLGVPMPIVIYLVLIVLCIWLLHRTKYGERLYLIGVNQQAAEYSGINTRLVIMSTYVLSAVSAALAGTILTSNVNSAKYNLGSGYTLAIITAVVLGGTLNTGGKGSILGTVLASLIICILRYGLPLCFDVSTQNLDLPVGIILVLVVLGREIAGRGMIAKAIRSFRKSAAAS